WSTWSSRAASSATPPPSCCAIWPAAGPSRPPTEPAVLRGRPSPRTNCSHPRFAHNSGPFHAPPTRRATPGAHWRGHTRGTVAVKTANEATIARLNLHTHLDRLVQELNAWQGELRLDIPRAEVRGLPQLAGDLRRLLGRVERVLV